MSPIEIDSLFDQPPKVAFLVSGFPNGSGESTHARWLQAITKLPLISINVVNRNLANIWAQYDANHKSWPEFVRYIQNPDFNICDLLEPQPENEQELQAFSFQQTHDPDSNAFFRQIPEKAVEALFDTDPTGFILGGDLPVIIDLINQNINLESFALPIIRFLITVDKKVGNDRVYSRMVSHQEPIFDERGAEITDPDLARQRVSETNSQRLQTDWQGYKDAYGIEPNILFDQDNIFIIDSTKLNIEEVQLVMLGILISTLPKTSTQKAIRFYDNKINSLNSNSKGLIKNTVNQLTTEKTS